MDNKPKICKYGSIRVEVEKGKKYMWCACGLSAKQPFCDGSHHCTQFAPIAYIAEKDGLVGFCGCKHSKNGPICDGSHKSLTET